ncbi:hypothetical protein GPECTOR_48g427 [Gonium pectorale]|uniref:Uncharacterized protein n=1 Tax=Gonium pectorale TaxID=33097 RepID=A0A150G8W8_GONPE|nr:hypothetical protein GPECTOR_48g427 [Gonium pectorale]|eukprot:KXZ45995.1 hypothetical protein GPECTOR_48g427 [Gonium pectorale]
MNTNGLPDTPTTKTPRIIASDPVSKADLRVTEVAVAYMDDGREPLTDKRGRPIKIATVAVTVPAEEAQQGSGGSGTGGRITVAMVQLPAGYAVDSAAVQDALTSSLSTGRTRTFLPAEGASLGNIPKEWARGGASSSQPKSWDIWDGAINTGTASGAGDIVFDDQGGGFSMQPTVRTSVVTAAASPDDGFQVDNMVTDTTANSGTDPAGNSRVCKRRMVAGRYRYFCQTRSS